MEQNRNTFWERLAKYFSGNATEEEKAWVREQKEKVPEYQEAFEQAQRVWRKAPMPENEYEPNVENGWQRFQLRVQTRAAEEPVSLPAKAGKNRSMWAVAASIALFMVLGYWLVTILNKEAWVEIQTAQHELRSIQLPDGSQVWLNENTAFSYPEDFQVNNRVVKLNGEAFFEVAKAEGKRFTVYAKDTKTEVIGTSFNINAYKNEAVKIQVVTGKVAFANIATEEAVFLEPGQEAIMLENKPVPVKKEIEDLNFQSWKTKTLNFNNTQLDQLVSSLERYFEVSIFIQNDALRNCRFTVSFENPELEEVLEILSITGNITITKQEDAYVLSGAGCN